MNEFKNFINGQRVSTGKTFEKRGAARAVQEQAA